MLGQMQNKTPQSMVSPVCLTGRLEDGISDGKLPLHLIEEAFQGIVRSRRMAKPRSGKIDVYYCMNLISDVGSKRDAYYHPTVDSSEEPFKWGLPDLDALRE